MTLPGFDLLTLRGREAAREYLRKLDPDFVVMAPPCTEWSQLQNVNQRTPMQVRGRRRKRKLQRTVLSFFDEVAQWQHERGRHGDRTAWMLENLLRLLAWRQEPLQATALLAAKSQRVLGPKGEVRANCFQPQTLKPMLKRPDPAGRQLPRGWRPARPAETRQHKLALLGFRHIGL